MQNMAQADPIKRHFTNAVSLINDWAPGLYFGAKDRFSVAVAFDKPLRWIRIGLRAELPLHLPRLAVYREDLQISVDPARVVASSYYDHRGEDLHQLNLRRAADMLSNTPVIGMHTEIEPEPWIEIDLGEAMSNISLRVWNRTDEWAWRNWALIVAGSVDAVRWERHYDHLELAKSVETLFRNARLNNEDPLAVAVYAFVEEACFSFLKTGSIDGDRLFSLAGKFNLPWHQCISNLNELFFRRFAREIGAHGLTKTFFYWEEEEKHWYLNATNNIISVMQEFTPDACLGFGGVLSYVRSGELIPHDDDLDIIIAVESQEYPTIPLALAAVEKFLRDRGFDVSGDFPSHRWIKIGNNINVDVFVGLKEGEFVSFFPGPRCSLKLDEIFPPMKVFMHDVQVLIPLNPFSYLEKIYGKSWRIPDRAFEHRWHKADFSDII